MQTVTYQKLYNVLREKILNKEYLPGTRIPTERELCDEYGVSRITVRHALSVLKDQCFIERMQGRGTFVRSSKPKKVAIMDFAYTKAMKQETPGLVRELISNEMMIPPAEIREWLNLLQKEKCLFLERLDILDKEPLAYDQVYILAGLTTSMTEDLLTRVDFLSIWEKREAIKISFVQETIEAVEADSAATELLKVKVGSPILMETEIMFDRDERPLAIFISKYRSDRFKMVSINTRGNDASNERDL